MSVLIPTDFRHGWAIFGPLADKNTWKGVLLELPASEKFSGLFLYMLWDISLKLGIYVKWVVLHVKFEFHSNLDTLTYFTAKNRSKSFICIHGFKNYIEASDLVHTQIVSVLTPIDFCHAWAIFGPLVDKNTRKGKLVELPASDTWGLSFIRIRSLSLKSFLDFFSKCCAVSTWKVVYTLSRLHNILSSCFTRMGSLWPSCS